MYLHQHLTLKGWAGKFRRRVVKVLLSILGLDSWVLPGLGTQDQSV